MLGIIAICLILILGYVVIKPIISDDKKDTYEEEISKIDKKHENTLIEMNMEVINVILRETDWIFYLLLDKHKLNTTKYFAGGTLCIDYLNFTIMINLNGTYTIIYNKKEWKRLCSPHDMIAVFNVYFQTKGLTKYG